MSKTKTVPEPASDHVIVADQIRGTTINGIELPENIRNQAMVFGLVIFKGPKVSGVTQVQDLVGFGPYAGKLIAIDGVEFRTLKEEQIELYLRQVAEPEHSDREVGDAV